MMHVIKNASEIARLSDDELAREIRVWEFACVDSVVTSWINEADQRRNKLLGEQSRRERANGGRR